MCKAKMKVSWIILFITALVLVDARSIKKYDDAGEFLCSKSTPCGWEVYEPYARTVEYYMNSPCTCPEKTKCVKSEEDISISAYVYHCRAGK